MAAIGTRLLKIQIGAPGSETEYNAEVSKAVVTSAATSSDFVSFADAAAGGGRDYVLEFTAVQDAATASLWSEMWTNVGDEVSVIMCPYGNTTATVTEPQFQMTAVISEPDGDVVGGEADSSTTKRFTFDCKWDLTARPTLVTT